MKKTSLIAALAALGMLICGAAQAQNSTNRLPSMVQPPAPHAPAPRLPMDRYLNLTDEQAAKVNPVLTAQQHQIMAVIQNSSLSKDAKIDKIRSIHDDTSAQLQKLLTPEQFKKWQAGQRFPIRRFTPMTHTNAPAAMPANAPPAP